MKDKIIIGGLEDLSLPDWGIPKIRARVDTGARTSAIHVEDLKHLPNRKVRFYVVVGWKKKRKKKRVIATIAKTTYIRPSTGKRIARYVVSTTMVIGEIRRHIELTLADRGKMRYRMLLGRTAIGSNFLVDPSRRCVLKNMKNSH